MKTKNIFLTLALALCTTFAFAQLITGSPHDLSAALWNTGTDEICITCHTPHNAQAITDAPLWNRVGTVTAPTALYASSTLQSTMAAPTGTSKLCLGCHDGTVDIGAFGANGTTGGTITGTKNLGTDLSTHHPVSFTYDTALETADGGLHDPTADPVLALLFSGNVECASCHDAHNNVNTNFLRQSNAASALCLTCHNK